MPKVIPQPLPIPFIGNVLDIDFERRVVSLCKLAEKYGKVLPSKPQPGRNKNKKERER